MKDISTKDNIKLAQFTPHPVSFSLLRRRTSQQYSQIHFPLLTKKRVRVRLKHLT